MKRCEYCGKNISYHEQYCCEDCSNKAQQFYSKEKRYKNIFGFFNVVCIISILASCFIALLFSANVALIVAGVSLSVLGVTIILIPLPTLNQIKNFKIKRAVFQTKIIGIISVLAGIIIFLFGILNLYVY